MRVLLLIDSLDSGGAESVVVPFARHLDRARIELHALALFDIHAKHRVPTHRNLDALRDLGVPTVELHTRNLRDARAFRQLQHEIRARQIEVVHAHLTFSIIWGALASRLAHLPFIATLHGFGNPPRGSRHWLWESLVRFAARRASRVVCVSGALRDYYLRQARLDAARTVTIYNGLELDRFGANEATRAEKRRELGIPDNAPAIMMVALLREGKGHDELLAAVPSVRQHIPNARVFIVGGGAREAELRQAAQPLGSSVIFLGHRDDIPALLSAGDLFVLPSYVEALPTVVLEAMAARLPVVATRVGGIPEIVREGETGLLIEAHDSPALAQAILSLLQSPARAREMGIAGRARVEAQFSAQRCAQSLMALYDQVRAESAQETHSAHKAMTS
jgi:glycosyltransferase involved in cell wall biosynthesis